MSASVPPVPEIEDLTEPAVLYIRATEGLIERIDERIKAAHPNRRPGKLPSRNATVLRMIEWALAQPIQDQPRGKL